jgi:hypothetical protein
MQRVEKETRNTNRCYEFNGSLEKNADVNRRTVFYTNWKHPEWNSTEEMLLYQWDSACVDCGGHLLDVVAEIGSFFHTADYSTNLCENEMRMMPSYRHDGDDDE